MRRVFATVLAAALALTIMAPVAIAQGSQVTDVSITSITVDRAGTVTINGSFYCQQLGDGTWVNFDGGVTQAIGHKFSIYGGFNGKAECANGPTYFALGVQAWTGGTFSAGWARVDIGNFSFGGCSDPNDPNTCWQQWIGGGNNLYVKIVKK
jgi:hypothetical protein